MAGLFLVCCFVSYFITPTLGQFDGPNGCDTPWSGSSSGAPLVPWTTSGVAFTINAQTILESDVITLEVNGAYEFTIASVTSFAAALLRVQQGNSTDNFDLSPLAAVEATSCVAPVVGLTSLPQTSLTGQFVSFTTSDPVVIDVTVVWNTTPVAQYTAAQFTISLIPPNTSSSVIEATSPVTTPPTIDALQSLQPTPSLETVTTSPAPSFTAECWICGRVDYVISRPDATVTLNGVVATCSVVAVIAQFQLIPPAACSDATAVVTANCGCTANGTTPAAPVALATLLPTASPTALPTSAPTVTGTALPTGTTMAPTGTTRRPTSAPPTNPPTLAPTASVTQEVSICHVCGSPLVPVSRPDNVARLGNLAVTCAVVYEMGRLSLIAANACAETSASVQANCGCGATTLVTVAPVMATRPTSAPSLRPPTTAVNETVATSTTRNGRDRLGGGPIAGIVLGILIGIVGTAVVAYCVVSQKQPPAPPHKVSEDDDLNSVQLSRYDFDQDTVAETKVTSASRPLPPIPLVPVIYEDEELDMSSPHVWTEVDRTHPMRVSDLTMDVHDIGPLSPTESLSLDATTNAQPPDTEKNDDAKELEVPTEALDPEMPWLDQSEQPTPTTVEDTNVEVAMVPMTESMESEHEAIEPSPDMDMPEALDSEGIVQTASEVAVVPNSKMTASMETESEANEPSPDMDTPLSEAFDTEGIEQPASEVAISPNSKMMASMEVENSANEPSPDVDMPSPEAFDTFDTEGIEQIASETLLLNRNEEEPTLGVDTSDSAHEVSVPSSETTLSTFENGSDQTSPDQNEMPISSDVNHTETVDLTSPHSQEALLLDQNEDTGSSLRVMVDSCVNETLPFSPKTAPNAEAEVDETAPILNDAAPPTDARRTVGIDP